MCSRKPRAQECGAPSVSEGTTPGARGFLLCIVTEESKSNYFRVSCKKCTFSCKICTHHSIINMKSTSLVMFSCSFCRFLFAP